MVAATVDVTVASVVVDEAAVEVSVVPPVAAVVTTTEVDSVEAVAALVVVTVDCTLVVVARVSELAIVAVAAATASVVCDDKISGGKQKNHQCLRTVAAVVELPPVTAPEVTVGLLVVAPPPVVMTTGPMAGPVLGCPVVG